MKSSVIWEELVVELPSEVVQEEEMGSGHVRLGGDYGTDPEPAGEIMSLCWHGNASLIPLEKLEEVAGEKKA